MLRVNKKILCLLHLPPPKYGVTLLNESILKGNLKSHFQVDTISINTSRKLADIEGISLGKISFFLKILIALLKRLFQNKYSLCYFSLTPTGIGFYKDLILVSLIKIFRIKTLYHLHGKGIFFKKNFLNDIFYKFAFCNSNIIITSQLLFYDIDKYVNKKNVYILPHGIKESLEDADFESVVKYRLNRGTLNLLFLSNMIRSKGVFIALEAAKVLKDKKHNFKFYFVGEWYDIKRKEFFNEVKRRNIDKEVEYLGFKKGKEKEKILKDSDIFVYPTYKDIFGIVNIEAMQFGLPVVSTYEGAIPEIVEDNVTGFLVPQKDSRALAEKIEILINNPDLRIKMSRAGREKFLREYTFDKFENRLIGIFKKEIKCAE